MPTNAVMMQPPASTARTGPRWVWPALAGMLLLAACASGGDEDSGTTATGLAGRQFVAISVTGHRLAQPERITIAFPADEGREGTWIESTGGCNDTESRFSIEDGRLRRTGDRMTTAVGCDQVRLDQDDWLDAWLAREPEVAHDGGRLTLAHDGVRIELREQMSPGS